MVRHDRRVTICHDIVAICSFWQRISIPLMTMAFIGCGRNEIAPKDEAIVATIRSSEELAAHSGKTVIIEGALVIAGRYVEVWPRAMKSVELIGIEDTAPFEIAESSTIRVQGLLTWRWKLMPKPTGIDNSYETRIPQQDDVWVKQYQLTVEQWEVARKKGTP